jgi:BirA family biotin operon repressor/biotin-[acetyl-CoA-carboxylase] ligase
MQDPIIALLSSSSFVSGESMSRDLGISRAAVWKKILGLRRKGYQIEAVPSRGYRLIMAPDLAGDFISAKACGGLWKEIFVHDLLGSTNDTAMSLAVEGRIQPGTVIIADSQMSGKGRLGRKWTSPAGRNVHMSMVIRPEIEPGEITMLTILAAVAAASAIRRSCDMQASIKWPNDLMFKERKLGGILTEVRADQDRVNMAVIGIGINVNIADTELPEEIRQTATSVYAATNRSHARNEIIICLLREFESAYRTVIERGSEEILERWREYSSTLGRRVKVTIGETVVTGIAEDIDRRGMLILRTDSGVRSVISAGDITHLRPAG